MKTKTAKKLRTLSISNPIFSGEYWVSVSENRIALPTKIYNQLASVDESLGVRVTRSPEGCIVVVPEKFWDHYCKSVAGEGNSFTMSELAMTSIALAKTASLKSGRRVTIPRSFVLSLLGDAKKGKVKVVVIGSLCWIKIWPMEEWKRRLSVFYSSSRKRPKEA